MNKSKWIKKTDTVRLVIASEKGQQLDEREVYAINNEGVEGLLYFTIVQKKHSFKLVYDLTGFITLREFLKNPLRKETFGRILQNIFNTLQAMQAISFRQQKLYLDVDYVMVNPATQKISFVYLPITTFENGVALRNFLLKIIQIGSFAADEDRGYVRKYIEILNDGINFSVFELEQYIQSLEEDVDENQRRRCPHCQTEVSPGNKFCPICGTSLLAQNEKKNRIYNPLDDGMDEQIPTEHNTFQHKGNTQNFTTVLADDETSEDSGATSVLGSSMINSPVYPYLIREKNGEKIQINKISFRIGKEKGCCDYWVSDNSAVSRSHANIITKNNRYYIVDMNSTNHTYVDGRTIPTEQEIEIFSGTKVRLGNEEFTFYIAK